jgi:hypothetical protein
MIDEMSAWSIVQRFLAGKPVAYSDFTSVSHVLSGQNIQDSTLRTLRQRYDQDPMGQVAAGNPLAVFFSKPFDREVLLNGFDGTGGYVVHNVGYFDANLHPAALMAGITVSDGMEALTGQTYEQNVGKQGIIHSALPVASSAPGGMRIGLIAAVAAGLGALILVLRRH